MTSKTFTCAYCAGEFTTQQLLAAHLRQLHAEQEQFRETLQTSIEEEVTGCSVGGPSCETAFDGTFRCYEKDFRTDSGYDSLLRDPLSLLRVVNRALVHLLVSCLTSLVSYKFQLRLTVEFGRAGETINASFWSAYTSIPSRYDIPRVLEEAYEKINNDIDGFSERGGGWVVDSVTGLRINVGKYDPFKASSYIPLPKTLRQKRRFVVNVENREDNKCFLYSVLAAKHRCYYVDPLHYDQWMDTVDSSMLKYPVELGKMEEFEERNGLSINVIAYTAEFGLHPVRVSKFIVGREVIDLLFLAEGNEGLNFHYCAIMDFDGFFSYACVGRGKKFFCRNCFSGFTTENALQKHQIVCFAVNPEQRLKFPKLDKNTLEFKQFSQQNKHNWIIYADFKCLLQPVTGPDQSASSTTIVHKHVPCSYGYVVLDQFGEIVNEKYYFGLDCVENFMASVQEEAVIYSAFQSEPEPLAMTDEEEARFKLAEKCHYCDKGFYKGWYRSKKALLETKVRDHIHFPPGNYRGAAHVKCNLHAREISTIPIVFRNIEHYDIHLLVSAADMFPGSVKVIPRTAERFQGMAVTMETPYLKPNSSDKKLTVTLRFIDFHNFLGDSLETHVTNLKNGGSNFEILRAGLESNSLGSQLPANVNDSDNDNTVQQMKEVYLLAEVFENFRTLCLANFRIDPCYYFSAPDFSWAAALRQTKVQLDLFTHVNKHNFIMSGIRGGLSYVARRYAAANNKYIPDTYDPTKPSIYLMYYEANSLNEWAMCQKLPHSNFRWLTREECRLFNVLSVPDDSYYGYILEVDLDYPGELHDEHSEFPLAPELKTIDPSMVSDYSRKVAEKIGHDIKSSTKLVSTLLPKRKYVVHYRNLKHYLECGMVLRRIRRILRFKQVAWVKPYIEGNVQRRQAVTNDFEKSLYQLVNSSVFGKTKETKHNTLSVKLLTEVGRSVKYTSLPQADSFQILNEGLISVPLKAGTITCDLPIYSGFAILELSKLLMYQFHYGYVKQKYGNKASLLFTDTDSLFYAIETDDVYTDIAGSEWFDTSNYDRAHHLFSSKYKQIVGKMKDRLGGKPVVEFVGLRSKMYSYITEETSKQTLIHEDYRRCLEEHVADNGSGTTIRDRKHHLTTDVVTKSLLSPYDDKRFLLADGIYTFAYGHRDIGMTAAEESDEFVSDKDVDSDLELSEKKDLQGKGEEARVRAVIASREVVRMENFQERERRVEADKARKAKRERERCAAMSAPEKAARNERRAKRKRERRAAMSAPEKAARNERRAKRQRERYAAMSAAEKAAENERGAKRKRERRAVMSEAEKAARNEKLAKRQRERRAGMSEAEKAAENEREAKRNRER